MERQATSAVTQKDSAEGIAMTFLDDISDVFVAFDKQWNFIYINNAAARIFCKEKSDMLGKNLWCIFSHLVGTPLYHKCHEAVRSQETQEYEYFSPPDEKWLHVTLYPTSTGLSAYFTDVTFRKQIETSLSEDEARKDEFISNASHELKTPVTSLKGYTQYLIRMFERQGIKEPLLHLSKMDTQIDRLSRLITDLLDVSRMKEGIIPYALEEVDIALLVREVVEDLQHRNLNETQPLYRITIQGTVQKKVKGDKDRLEQVLSNLISNAIKYSPNANRVDISITSNDAEAIVHVRDHGIGIAQEHIDRIFERFYRVHGTDNKTFTGMGLGLHISHEIIQRHGGRMWVNSTPGQGSTFSFSLPL